ncbi:ABC1 family-domain-containing protein, partial [Jimgerdemannia flammicorona]
MTKITYIHKIKKIIYTRNQLSTTAMATPTAQRLADLLALAHASTNIVRSFANLQSAHYQNFIKTSSIVGAINATRRATGNEKVGDPPAGATATTQDCEPATKPALAQPTSPSTSPTIVSLYPSSTIATTSLKVESFPAPLISTPASALSLSTSTSTTTSKPTPTPSPAPYLTTESTFEDQMTQLPRHLRESRIPTTRASRLWHYGSLVTGLGIGAMGESLRRFAGISTADAGSSVLLTDANVDRLVERFTRMRGAALKFGQMISIQGVSSGNNPGDGTEIVSPQLEKVLLKVHDSANYMPRWQMEQVLTSELGSSWPDFFSTFDPIPLAAASIGQVHAATLRSSNTPVVIKVQYPGVASSIDADLRNLKALLTLGRLLPRGLYLDNTIKVMRAELTNECDYGREADAMEKFAVLLENDKAFRVPKVYRECSTRMAITSERMEGIVLSRTVEEKQEDRDKIGTNLLRLCLRELFGFRFMQTDPNWSNFFYNRKTGQLSNFQIPLFVYMYIHSTTLQIELIDFGASREFDKRFTDLYHHVLTAATTGDREACWHYSKAMGFVTGYETEVGCVGADVGLFR